MKFTMNFQVGTIIHGIEAMPGGEYLYPARFGFAGDVIRSSACYDGLGMVARKDVQDEVQDPLSVCALAGGLGNAGGLRLAG